MSFLARSAQPLRQIVRTPIATRAFTVSATRPKGPVDAAKDALKTVDRKVSDKLVGGIKAGGKLPPPPPPPFSHPCSTQLGCMVDRCISGRKLTHGRNNHGEDQGGNGTEGPQGEEGV